MTDTFDTIDTQLRDMVIRNLPPGDSYGASLAIRANNCDNDLTKLILQRAKLRLTESADRYFSKPLLRVPFVLDPFESAKIIRDYGNVSDIISTRQDRVADFEFQVHKHYSIQSVINGICRTNVPNDENSAAANYAFYDGFDPIDYAMYHATVPSLRYLETHSADPLIPDCSFAIINLFDSRFTVTALYRAINIKVVTGSELFLVVPYDQKMWTVTAANISEGSYSYQWVTEDISMSNTTEFASSKPLPANFFRTDKAKAQLRIRPFGSNKIFTMTRDEFIAIFAQGMDEQSFPETRQISHGFAEVSIVNFYPVHQDNALAGVREVKRSTIPFNKRLLLPKAPLEADLKTHVSFARNLQPPWPYIIDDKLYDKTKKAAVQTRITRNMIVPLIYHLFAHSTHIVFNGAIITLQKVMSPELICQLTEHLLLEVVPIKLKILQAGNIIRTNASISKTQLVLSAARAIIICAYNEDSAINTENLTRTIFDIFNNPNYLNSRDGNRTSTYHSVPTLGTSLDAINE